MPSGLDEIFDQLRPLLAEHVSPLAERTGGVREKRDYQLWV